MTQPWPNNYSNQADYVNDIEQRLAILHRKSVPASYVGTTRPTTAQMANAWSLKEGSTISVPPYGKTQWYNPATGRIENFFINLPTLGPDPLPVQTDEVELPAFELINRLVVQQGDTVTSFTASWSKVYRAIVWYWSARSTAAAVSAGLLMRPNASAANYSHAAAKVDQTPQATFDAAYNAATSLMNTTNIPGATAPNPYIFGQGCGTLYFPDSTAQAKSGFSDALWLTNDGSGATELRYNKHGLHWANLAAMTSLAFTLSAGNFAVGSKIVVFGLHPTT